MSLLAYPMKNLLITAATEAEIAPFIHFLREYYRQVNHNLFQNEEWNIRILISGAGMMASAFSFGKELATNKYDAAIQAGIAGSFDTSIPLGTIVAIHSEQYGDFGAEDNGNFIDIFDLGFSDRNVFPFSNGKLINQKPFPIGEDLQKLNAISINTVSGQADSIQNRKHRYNASVESMEGIAFHYACLQYGIPFIQIRAISNYVTPRNREEWKIGLAIENLNIFLQKQFATHQ
ncbi:MAG: futalosine hydrolase [Chitinophagaceae bacterium]